MSPPASPWQVPFLDLKKEFSGLEEPLMNAVREVLGSGEFILRRAVQDLEVSIAQRFGLPFVVGVNSGTDALYMAAEATRLGPGDEVLVPAHTFMATIAAPLRVGAKPILVDVDEDFNIDMADAHRKITPKTKAIFAVHMNGRMCDMDAVMALSQETGAFVVEDIAQALGAQFRGRFSGTFGRMGCFSFHPMKILNAPGDAGAVSSRTAEDHQLLYGLRNHGQVHKEQYSFIGLNSRLDNLHAAILNVKLSQLDWRIQRRREIAKNYHEALNSLAGIKTPPPPVDDGSRFDVFSSYVIRSPKRDALVAHLKQDGIETFSFWKTPNHQQPALAHLGAKLPKTEQISAEVVSLPIFPEITDVQQQLVVDSLTRFSRSM